MAESLYLETPSLLDASASYLADEKHIEAGMVALKILYEFPQVEVRKIQLPKGSKYTCWYVSVVGYEKVPVLNLGIYPNGRLTVEFRFMEYLSPGLREMMQWQTTNWPYVKVGNAPFTVTRTVRVLKEYIPLVCSAALEGRLKKGGTSAAESVISDILESLEGLEFRQGERPEWLRNPEGNLMQLDFWLTSRNLAIEVQGPYHFLDLHGKPNQLRRRQENDRHKIRICLEHGLSLIWMNSVGIQKSLVRMPFQSQVKHLVGLLQFTGAHHPCHVIWETPELDPKLG